MSYCIYIVMTVISQIHKHHLLETVDESPSQLQELGVYDISCTFLDLLETACVMLCNEWNVVRLVEWHVRSIRQIEGYIKEVYDLFVGFDCDFKAMLKLN